MNETEKEIEMAFEQGRIPRGMRWMITFSILTAVAWVAFLIVWLFFIANDYSIWENIGIVLLSILVFIGANAAVWVPWGMRFAPMEERRKMIGARGIASAVIGIAACAFLIYWLFYWADDFSIYQNLAILLLVIVVGGGLNAIVWVGHDRC